MDNFEGQPEDAIIEGEFILLDEEKKPERSYGDSCGYDSSGLEIESCTNCGSKWGNCISGCVAMEFLYGG
jgi:hypothetical protein